MIIITNLNFYRPEKEEVEMMNAVIPHLRLLTLPMDKLGQVAKYLSDSQLAYLAKRLMYKGENIPGKVSPSLNLSTSSRSRPKSQNFKLEFIAEDLIKNNWQMMGLELKENKMWNNLQIHVVAEQHLVVKGIEILTRANNSPKIEFVNNEDEISSR